MTILSDETLLKYIEEERIGIDPYPEKSQLQPCSIDLRLGNEFKQFIKGFEIIDTVGHTDIEELMTSNDVHDDSHMIIAPHSFVLATTKEYIKVPDDLVARVEGRSSLGRLGLTMHVTAGFIDSGFEGNITLEIANLSDKAIILYPNQRVCQIVFEELDKPCRVPYGALSRNSKYQGQTSVECSKINKDND